MTLKERRKAAGLTQAQVGKKLDVDQAAVCRWERGECTPVKKYRKKLCKLFKCTEEELLGELT